MTEKAERCGRAAMIGFIAAVGLTSQQVRSSLAFGEKTCYTLLVALTNARKS